MRVLIFATILLTACQPASSDNNLQQALLAANEPSPIASAVASATPAASVAATSHIQVAGRTIAVEIADTFQSRQKGLSGRPSLAKGTGLVLYWPRPEPTSIWMPDMNFAIDVIFVRDDKIVFIEKNAQPCPSREDCPTFGTTTPVNYVLEVPAGSVTEWGIKVGDPIQLVR